jgi:hypothetical protein
MENPSIEAKVSQLGDRVGSSFEAARQRMAALNAGAARLIKEHTAVCLLGAVAVGYVVARVARRQS